MGGKMKNYSSTENPDYSVFALLGELRADVKHIIAGLERSKEDMKELRAELTEDNEALNARITKVEKFHTKVTAYAAVALPSLIIAAEWLKSIVLALII